MAAKSVWLFVMYVLVNSVFYTFLKANSTVYMVRAFKTEDEIVSLSTYGNIITFAGVLVLNVTFPILMGKLVTSASGWRTLVLLPASGARGLKLPCLGSVPGSGGKACDTAEA